MAKKKPGKGQKPPPKCKAILLCDQVIVEAATGKVSVIGIFGGWVFPHFPHSTPSFTVFLQLTDGIGKYAISMEVHDLQSDQIIAQAPIKEIEFRDRKKKVSLPFSVSSLPIPQVGRYDFIVLANGQEIDRQQFQAIQNSGGSPRAAEES